MERRLFGWLLALSLVPALALVAIGTWVWTRQLNWFGTLGPWENVAESGRTLFDAADSAAISDPALKAALEAHRLRLSESLLLSRRWSFVGERLSDNLPFAAFTIAAFLAAIALAVSRSLARQLARPINELVEWTNRIARDEPLPPPHPRERREVREFRVLREAFRIAAADLTAGRQRAVAAEA
jgi:hypothetical protein